MGEEKCLNTVARDRVELVYGQDQHSSDRAWTVRTISRGEPASRRKSQAGANWQDEARDDR